MIKKLNVKKLFVFFLVTLVTLLLVSTTIYAIYIRNSSFNGVVTSDKYYFESDLLSESGETYELNSGTTEVSFSVKNFVDGLRISEVDIEVTISTSGGTLDKNEITLDANLQSSDVIILSGLTDGNTYTVSAKGTSGYEKELTATFVVRSSDKEIYKYIDKSNPAYVLVTVWSTEKTGDVVISFDDANIVPDKTWPTLLDFDLNQTTVNVHVENYTSYVYRFFVKSTSDLSKISVKYNGTELNEKAPS